MHNRYRRDAERYLRTAQEAESEADRSALMTIANALLDLARKREAEIGRSPAAEEKS
jgi:hypothetical protein